MAETIHPRARSGHDLQPGDRVRPRRPSVATAQQEFEQILPAPGLVEHDPEAIWSSQLAVAREALAEAKLTAADIAAIGVTNQRETTILWERATGRPVGQRHRLAKPRQRAAFAIGSRPTAWKTLFREKTGLVVDAYFSGTKIKHLLDTIAGLRARAEAGEILFGTVDTWLIWRLTGGKRHVTDYSNASRTLIFNIHTLEWDDELLKILDIPRAMLPEVRPSSEVSARPTAEWFGAPIPIAGCAGDQQAATFGQACFEAGQRQEHLRHRLLPAAQHRARGGRLEKQAADHDRLGTGRQDHLLPRRLGVHRRRGRAVAARRAGDHQAIGRRRGAGRSVPRFGRRVLRAGVRRPGRAVLGSLCPRRDRRASRAARPRPTSRGRRSNRWPFNRAMCSKPCSATPACR